MTVRITGTTVNLQSDILNGQGNVTSVFSETEYFGPWGGAHAQGMATSGAARLSLGSRLGYYYTSSYVNSSSYYWIPHYFGMRDDTSGYCMLHSYDYRKIDTTAQRMRLRIYTVGQDGHPLDPATDTFSSSSTSNTGTIATSTTSGGESFRPGWYWVRLSFTDQYTAGSRVAFHYRSNGASGQSMATMWNTLTNGTAGTSSTAMNTCFVSPQSGTGKTLSSTTNGYPMVGLRVGIDTSVNDTNGTFDTGPDY